jgi:hypothetical protein
MIPQRFTFELPRCATKSTKELMHCSNDCYDHRPHTIDGYLQVHRSTVFAVRYSIAARQRQVGEYVSRWFFCTPLLMTAFVAMSLDPAIQHGAYNNGQDENDQE